MEIMFNSIIGGIMIDAFGELKEQDSARDEDKETFCYICNMKKAEVLYFLFRCKELGQHLKNI